MIFDKLITLLEVFLINVLNEYFYLALLILFFIIFAETGLVFLPFLPGDSLIFIVGTVLSSTSLYHLSLAFIFLSLAAILGDNLNYLIGNKLGRKIISSKRISKNYIEKTEQYYERFGAKTIFLARFIPVVRTFAPFVAGIGNMYYGEFLFYNVIGAIIWIGIFLFGGYFFGNLPFVKENLTIIVIAIICSSIIPVIYELIRGKKRP